MVPNTSELLPEPETPVKTVRRRLGISTLTSLRLFSRAPCTRISSWPSATCDASALGFVLIVAPYRCVIVAGAGGRSRGFLRRGVGSGARRVDGSGGLVDADHVARGVAEGAVADAVGLVGGFLEHFAAGGADALEGRVAVVGGEVDAAQQALGEQFGGGVLVGLGGVRVADRRFEDDLDVGLRGRAEGD